VTFTGGVIAVVVGGLIVSIRLIVQVRVAANDTTIFLSSDADGVYAVFNSALLNVAVHPAAADPPTLFGKTEIMLNCAPEPVPPVIETGVVVVENGVAVTDLSITVTMKDPADPTRALGVYDAVMDDVSSGTLYADRARHFHTMNMRRMSTVTMIPVLTKNFRPSSTFILIIVHFFYHYICPITVSLSGVQYEIMYCLDDVGRLHATH
jgi:hypothetical protein